MDEVGQLNPVGFSVEAEHANYYHAHSYCVEPFLNVIKKKKIVPIGNLCKNGLIYLGIRGKYFPLWSREGP